MPQYGSRRKLIPPTYDEYGQVIMEDDGYYYSEVHNFYCWFFPPQLLTKVCVIIVQNIMALTPNLFYHKASPYKHTEYSPTHICSFDIVIWWINPVCQQNVAVTGPRSRPGSWWDAR